MKIFNTYDQIPINALTGMRLSRNSTAKSEYPNTGFITFGDILIDDIHLMSKLINRGSSHRKFLRMCNIFTFVEAPLFWWKHLDTYKYIVSLSDSTMYGIGKRESFSQSDFEKRIPDGILTELNTMLKCLHSATGKSVLEQKRELFNALPGGYLSTRSISLNYETFITVIQQRKKHMLKEWTEFIYSICNKLEFAKFVFYNI